MADQTHNEDQAPPGSDNTEAFVTSTGVNQFYCFRALHSPYSLGGLIYEHAAKSNRVQADKVETAAKFRDELRSLAGHLETCETGYQMPGSTPEFRERLSLRICEGEMLLNRVSELVDVCEQAMSEVEAPLHEDGSYTQEAWDEFMRVFLGRHNALGTTLHHLTREIKTWSECCERDYVPTLDWLRQHPPQGT